MLLQEITLRLGFHALGNYFYPQVMGHADDGLHDDCVGGFHANVAHEGPVDLQLVERQLRQVGKR